MAGARGQTGPVSLNAGDARGPHRRCFDHARAVPRPGCRERPLSGRRASFGKRDRERAKKEKAAAKRDARQNRSADAAEGAEEGVVDGGAVAEVSTANGEAATARLLEAIGALHQRFDDGGMSYDEFEEQKAELMGRLTVD